MKSCIFLLLSFLILAFPSCSPTVSQTGKATYYSNKFIGRRTANGEIYRKGRKTAAHRTLPFGTKVKVTNLENGRTVRVRINDRGPFIAGRIIDLSARAARKIGIYGEGVGRVRLKYKKHK